MVLLVVLLPAGDLQISGARVLHDLGVQLRDALWLFPVQLACTEFALKSTCS